MEDTFLNDILFSINNLHVTLKNTDILQDITCQIPAKRVCTIIGSSGAGKSTFLRTLVRLLDFTGKIEYQEKSLQEFQIRDLRKTICYVPQVPEMFPGTVESNILWARSLWKLGEKPDYVKHILHQVDLDESIILKQATDLSVGQKQRVCLARSLAVEPDVLLLDEPDSALDAISKENFELLIKRLQQENPNLTIIMVTHDLYQAKRISEYVILLDKGKCVSHGEAKKYFDPLLSKSESQLLKDLLNTREDN